jgi:transcriptional regulator with XRE-family HTH domain
MNKATAARTANTLPHKPKIPREIDRRIGNNLRRLRLARGLSQTDLANHFGLTFQQVQKYEKGSNRLAGSRLIQACELLQVAPADILGTNASATAVPDDCHTLGMTRSGLGLAQAFNAIKNHDHRYLVLRLARALAGLEDALKDPP